MAKNKQNEKPSIQTITTGIASIVSIAALILAGLSYSHTVNWDERMANIDSYKEQLNFKITWEQTEDAATVETIPYEPLGQEIVSKLPNQKLKVSATTGGVKAVSVLFYSDGDLLANLKIDLSDAIDQAETDASEPMYACEVLSLHPQTYTKTNTGGKYYSSAFVVVEGFNDDYYIVPTVFEFNADKDGKMSGDAIVREYNEFDTLFVYNETLQQIPEFDKGVLKDYLKIKERLDI